MVGLSLSANTGAWMDKSIIVTRAMLKIFAMSALVNFDLTCLKSFPQFGQNGSKGFGVGLHVGQGGVGLGCLKAFSVIASNNIVPMNMSAVAPTVWKICSARFSPKL